MKVNLTLGPGGPKTRDKAKVCLMMNLGVPGSGSLMAGRIVGYPQLFLMAAGMIISMIFAGKFLTWFFANWSRLQNPSNDPMEMLVEIWQAVKWPLAGLALFGFAWLWALVTGFSILVQAKKGVEGEKTSNIQHPTSRE
jgi:hypothetical protein